MLVVIYLSATVEVALLLKLDGNEVIRILQFMTLPLFEKDGFAVAVVYPV